MSKLGRLFAVFAFFVACWFAFGALTNASPSENFNCRTREVWTAEKREWCCQVKNLGCPVVAATDDEDINEDEPYNCLTKERWMPDKIEWCCANKNLGCMESEGQFTTAPTSSSPPSTTYSENPTYLIALNGAEVMFEAPAIRAPRAVLFLAHGCSHSATDFWSKSESCPQCFGLPEERRIVTAALRRGYVAIAVSSEDRFGSRCWGWHDGEVVAAALKEVREAHGWQNLPTVAVGASSGGGFVGGILPQHVNLTAVDIQIMAISAPPPNASPAVFTHMPRDVGTAEFVAENIESWPVETRQFAAHPLPINSTFFSSRIQGINETLSRQITAALKKSDLIDDAGFLTKDPRRTDWRSVLKTEIPGITAVDALTPDASWISEELNVAWALHEIIGDFIEPTFDFFEEMMKRPHKRK